MGNKKRTSYVVGISLLWSLSPLLAAATLDTSFGQGVGYVTTQNGQGFQINDVQIQSDEKIVAVGQTKNPNTQAIIARYTTDGILDSSFGTNGIVTARAGSTLSTTVIEAVALQTDGKIVVVGYTFDTNSATQVIVARYTTAGALDSTFGSGGVVTAPFGSGSTLNSVVVDASGRIVVAGVAVVSGTPNGLIARLTTNGTLDGTFGNGGSIIGLIGLRTGLNDVALDASGNIIVAGYTSTSSGDQGLIARYTTSGVIDGSFGSGGIVTVLVGTRTMLKTLAIDSGGNIVIGGFANITSTDQFIVARYTTTGSLDNTFGSSGYVTTLIGNGSRIHDIVIQTDGKIVVGGYIENAFLQGVIARYTSAGVLDSTFANSGSLLLSIGKESIINALALQADGKTVAGGYETDSTTSQSFGLVLRLNKNNTDFVNITSITTSSISTKIPTISGTSSAVSSSVQVVINGVVFSTVATDGSGNWNAGTSTVLPSGTNTIEAILIVFGSPVVAHEIQITVVDTFGEDAVFAYDTTTQTITSLSDVTFNTNAQIGTWAHTAGTASFTCKKSGTYKIEYVGMISEVASAASFSASMRLVKNGTEIAGSQIADSFSVSGTQGLVTLTAGSASPLTNAVIVVVASGDVIKVQALGTNAQLAPTGSGTTRPSAGIVITRIA